MLVARRTQINLLIPAVVVALATLGTGAESYGEVDATGQTTGPKNGACLATPTGLTASDGAYSNKVRLEWIAVPDAISYEVWRNTSDNLGSALQIATRSWAACEDKSAAVCTTYWYWVRAIGACGESDFSASNSGYAFDVPTTPTGLTASDGTYTDKIRLEWTGVPNATGYEIWRNTSNDPGSATQIATRTWTACEDKSVAPCTTYWYWVRATGACGASDVSTVDDGFRLLATPTGLAASDQTYVDKVRIEWNAVPGATGYEVWRSTSNSLGSAVKIATRTWAACEDKSVTACTLYWYWVCATGPCGPSGFTTSDDGSAFGFPAAPTGVTASDGTYADKIRLQWTAVSGATGYEIWRNTSDTLGSATQIATRTWAAFEDKSAVAGTTYWYWVRATGACGTGDFSASDSGYVLSLEMISVSSGTFTMGRPYAWDQNWGVEVTTDLPTHSVALSTYQIGKGEVTNQQYCAVLNWALPLGYLRNSAGGVWAWSGDVDIYAGGDLHLLLALGSTECNIQYSGGVFSPKTRVGLPGTTSYSTATHPVVEVSWYGSVAFCNWLSQMQGLTPCYNMNTANWPLTVTPPTSGGYRLPTEAEWERAAAWDGAKHWVYGFTSDTLVGKHQCNYYDYSPDAVNPLGLTAFPYTAPDAWFDGVNVSPNGSVATSDSASPVGAYDMSGNAWEWCHDWYDLYGSGAQTNPTGASSGTYRVLRGGSWLDAAQYARSSYRAFGLPDDKYFSFGFRVARNP